VTIDTRYWDRDFETRPWAWIESWQAQQLALMLETLSQRSELYRERMDGAGHRVGLRGYWVSRGRLPTLDMLEPLPFTTRTDLLEAQDHARPGRPLGLQQAVPQEYIVQVASSAVPGDRPVFSGLTRRDQETWSEAIANVLWTAGIRPDDVVAHLPGTPMEAMGWPYADGLRRLGATVAWLGGQTLDEVLATLPRLHVTAVLTTTACALVVAENGGAGLAVRRLLTAGAPGLGQPATRERIAASWGTPHVRETMGLADVMAGMWSECEAAQGMHFSAARHVIVELVEPATGARLPWRDDVIGEAVYTTFDRDATPVLRYRSGERLVVTGTRCLCGRTSPTVRRALAAVADVQPNGETIGAGARLLKS
jgi:phenylacetate-coenzyme A ligase PaaK-like adenylate-forming protein